MGFLLFSAIFALSFAWMWSRNDRAKKRLKRLKPTDEDETMFAEWLDHTRKRMSRADFAALMLTIAPLSPLLGLLAGGDFVAIPFNICAWGSLILALRSNAAGRKADALAAKLGFQSGVGWLAAKKSTKKRSPPAIDPPQESTTLTAVALTESNEGETDAVIDANQAAAPDLKSLEQEFKRAERKEGMRNLILAALAILLIKTLINPSSHVLLPDVADSGPRQGCVVGFRYIKKTWWGFRKQTFDDVRFAAEKRPQYYDPDSNKWLDIPSDAYADAKEEEGDPYKPVEYFR
jgi:Flp pilus assembly protein TadB